VRVRYAATFFDVHGRNARPHPQSSPMPRSRWISINPVYVPRMPEIPDQQYRSNVTIQLTTSKFVVLEMLKNNTHDYSAPSIERFCSRYHKHAFRLHPKKKIHRSRMSSHIQ
jgi:hypothetical protein